MDQLTPPQPQSINNQQAESQRRVRQRALRACDACRKMKIKCLINSGEAPCEACKLSARACKFEHVGVKREKPPSIREIEQLNRKIAQLEAILFQLRPQIDLSSLPRTSDQAKTMANALQSSIANPSQSDNLHSQTTNLPTQPTPLPKSSNPFINEHEDPDQESSECEDDSYDEDEDEDEGDQNFQVMMKSLGRCQIGTSHLLDHEKSITNPTPPNHLSTSNQNINNDNPGEDQSLSVAEKYCLERYDLEVYPTQTWPDPDLASSLISIYFDTIYCYPPIIHQPEFRNQYQSGLANRNPQFAQLCFAIFAAASPYSDDPRVLYATQPNDPHPRQSAGALFAFTALFRILKPTSLDLFQLQTMAVISFYLLRMSSPSNTSATVQKFMRKAISSGVHLENSPQWNCSILRDQMRKRAFSALITVDKLTCKTLDYLRIPRALPNLVADPLYVDDAELDSLDAQDMMQPTQASRKHFREQLSSSAQTPGKAAAESLSAIRKKFEAMFQNMVLDQLSHPVTSSSTTTSTSSTDENVPPKNKTDSPQFTLQVASLLGDVIETEMPAIAKWNPSLTKKEDLHHTAMSTCLVRTLQIIVLLQVVATFPQVSQTCFQAATALVDVLEDLKVLGHLTLLDAAIPHFLCSVGSIYLWIISQHQNPHVSTDTQANAWLKMKSCIDILDTLAPTSFISAKLSQKFTDYMERLKEESHCPPMMNNTFHNDKKSSKRPFSEIMAKKLQEPTVSNFLYSHSSPSDVKSNDSNEDHRAYEKLKSLDINNFSDITSIVDFFQFPSPDQKPIPLAQTAIPNQNPIQANPSGPQIQNQIQAPYQHLQLQDLFPYQSEPPLNPPPNWNYGSGPLPFSGNQTAPMTRSSSFLTNPSISPLDWFMDYSSSRRSLDVPSSHIQPSTTTPPSFMPADHSQHLIVEGSSTGQNTLAGIAHHSQTTNTMPMNSISTNPTQSVSFHVNENDNGATTNLGDLGLNPATVPIRSTNMTGDLYQRLGGLPMNSISTNPTQSVSFYVNENDNVATTNLGDLGLNPATVPMRSTNMTGDLYQRFGGPSTTQDLSSTTINNIDPSELITPRTLSTNLATHPPHRQAPDPPDYSSLFTTQFGLKQSTTNPAPENSSSLNIPSFPHHMARQQPMSFDPSIDRPSTEFGPGSLPSSFSAAFNHLDGFTGPRSSSFATAATTGLSQHTAIISQQSTALPQQRHHSPPKSEALNHIYQNPLNSGFELAGYKEFFNNHHPSDFTKSNRQNRSQLQSHQRSRSLFEPANNGFVAGLSNSNSNFTGFVRQPDGLPPLAPFNSSTSPNRPDFNFELEDSLNNLPQNDADDIFSSICSSWLF